MSDTLHALPGLSMKRAMLFVLAGVPSYFMTIFVLTRWWPEADSPLAIFLQIEAFVTAALVSTGTLFYQKWRTNSRRVLLGHGVAGLVHTGVLLALLFLVVSLVYQSLTQPSTTSSRWVHSSALTVLLLGCGVILAANRKVRVKTRLWGRYITLQKQLLDASPWYPRSHAADEPREVAIAQIHAILENLSESLDEPSANLIYHFYRRKINRPRLLSVWFENSDHFACKFSYPTSAGAYSNLVRRYRPRKHDAEGYLRFLQTWEEGRPIRPERLSKFESERHTVTSAFGVLWEELATGTADGDGEPIIDISDLEKWPRDDFYLDRSFERFLNGGPPVRSVYMRLLKVGSKRLAILAIFDPLAHGLGIRDQDHLEAYCHLLQLVLARYAHFSLKEKEA